MIMASGNRKILAIALVAILAIAAVAAVVLLSDQGETASNTMTVTDASGTNVTMSKAPERIISGAPDISEIVAALNLTDKLVAVTDYCDYPAGVKALRDNGSTIGGFYTPSFEKTLSYTPDLVILNNGVQAQIDLAQQLRDAGYTVVIVPAATNLEAVYKNIEMIGKITGQDAAAKDLISDMKTQIASIESAVSNDTNSPNILFVTYADAGFTNVWPAGGTTAIGEVIDLAGGTNTFQEMDGFKMASDEVLKSKAASVDVIVMTIMYSLETPENTSAWFKADPIWKESPAVKNNKVYFLTGQAENIFNRESVRTVEAVQLMAQILHPDAFESKVPFTAEGVNVIGDEYTEYLQSATAAQSPSMTVTGTVSKE
jgi:iron complex transport system substrate-binding protein